MRGDSAVRVLAQGQDPIGGNGLSSSRIIEVDNRIPEGISLISPSRLDNLKAFLRVAPPGAVVEVGTYWGGTLRRLFVACPSTRGHRYDTSTGGAPGSGQ